MPAGETLAGFGATGATLAIHLAIHALPRVVAELTPLYGADCPTAVVARASWPSERVVRGTLATIEAALAEEPIDRTALILVGPGLAAAGFRESALYDADYQRRFRGGRERARRRRRAAGARSGAVSRGRGLAGGAGPGRLGSLTLEVVAALAEADAVVYDALVDPAAGGRRGAELHYVGKRRGEPSTPQAEINALLIRLAREGKRVLRLKGAIPTSSGAAGTRRWRWRAPGRRSASCRGSARPSGRWRRRASPAPCAGPAGR